MENLVAIIEHDNYPGVQVCSASGRQVSRKCGLNSPKSTYKYSIGNYLENTNHMEIVVSRAEWKSQLTFRPSTTNKCNTTPNRNSLYHFHARRADSTHRDDFNETGTK